MSYLDSDVGSYEEWDSLACLLCGRLTCQDGCCENATRTSNVVRSYLLKLSFGTQEVYKCRKCGAKKALRVVFKDYE